MPDISLIAMIGAAPMSGIVCSAYKANRFGALPVAYDTAAPGGAADATATSGYAFGGPGRVDLTVPTFEEYWVAIPSGGHIGWVKSPAPLDPIETLLTGWPAVVAKPLGDGTESHPIDWIHNDTSGFLIHLIAGADCTASLLGLGVTSTSPTVVGLVVDNVGAGTGIQVSNFAGASATASGIHGSQASIAPLVILEQIADGPVAPVLVLNAWAAPTAGQVLAEFSSYGPGIGPKGYVIGTIFADTGILTWYQDIEAAGGKVVVHEPGVTTTYHGQTHHKSDGLYFYSQSGSGVTYWPWRLHAEADHLKLQQASLANMGSESFTYTLLDFDGANNLLLTRGAAFWGHAAVASQPAAPATLADVIAIIRGNGMSA